MGAASVACGWEGGDALGVWDLTVPAVEITMSKNPISANNRRTMPFSS
jgi:hypothetical protein